MVRTPNQRAFAPHRTLSSPTVQLAILIALGLAARLIVLFSIARLPWFYVPNADSALYDDMARAFARGDWLIGTEPLRMSPVYPFFLGVVYRVFGVNPWGVRVVQTILGLGLVALTWDTARRLLGPRAALIAGGIVALFGPALFYEFQLLGDAPAAATAGLALWMMVRAMVRGEVRPSYWSAVGLVTGVVGLWRPNGLLLVAPLAAAAAWTGSSVGRSRRLVAATLGFLVGLSPVPVRNLLATGHATVVAVHGGVNFYVGNGPDATGAFRVPGELSGAIGPREQFDAFHTAAERAEGHPLDAEAADRYWMGRTLTFIIADPARWASLMVWKLRLFWNGRSLSDVEHYEFMRRLDPTLALPFVQWWALMPVAMVGTVLALRGRDAGAVVALFNLAWCCSVVIFFVVDRYRLPSLSGLAIAAVLGAWQARTIWTARSRSARAALLSLGATAVVIAWPVGIIDNSAEMWLRLGSGYERMGRLDEARAAYHRAADIAPTDVRARRGLERLGRGTR